ncbi:MAG: UDP-glucose/GDP-mannose dehydrogenase family protein [Alphaproteobacteria bacterium]|nr:UDP-glucose/GDP-mannose dehydrogenase family protein [Alphaproteobacteria bacterium]
MHIAMVGAGYVGLVSGACFSEFGFEVTCIDHDTGKIKELQQGRLPIYEPDLENLVHRNQKSRRLSFTTDLQNAVKKADVIFIAVGTPERRGSGHADLRFIYDAAKQIAHCMGGYKIIVTKSTVPIGTGKKIKEIIKKIRPSIKFDIVSNPEFLREGSAINDFMRPDRVIIGVETEEAYQFMCQLYRPLYLRETPIVRTSLESAEIIKYASNSFLAMKVTFINQISDLCEKVGANVQDVAKGIGLDGRIGQKFLHAGPGFGGSCFPKDTKAFIRTAKEYKTPQLLVEATIKINQNRKVNMAARIIKIAGPRLKGKKIAILGLTFKPNTDDVRESIALTILPALHKKGAKLFVFDPYGMAEMKKHINYVTYCDHAYETMKQADLLVILTEWNEFRALNLSKIKKLLHNPVIIDLRNIYNPIDMQKFGFSYYSLGRKA